MRNFVFYLLVQSPYFVRIFICSFGHLFWLCSAGVGRTGTYIAIDTLLDVIEKETEVDICGIIMRMRQQRMKMVQTVVSICKSE